MHQCYIFEAHKPNLAYEWNFHEMKKIYQVWLKPLKFNGDDSHELQKMKIIEAFMPKPGQRSIFFILSSQ